MKKYVSLIFLLIILFVGNGYDLLFIYIRHSVRREVMNEIRYGLKNKDLCLIVVSADKKNKITWVKTGKEFRYNGNMYDVVRVERKNNKTFYYCINDINEKTLIARYLKHNKKSRILLHLKKVLNLKYFPVQNIINLTIQPQTIDYYTSLEIYHSIIIDKLSPPPKV